MKTAMQGLPSLFDPDPPAVCGRSLSEFVRTTRDPLLKAWAWVLDAHRLVAGTGQDPVGSCPGPRPPSSRTSFTASKGADSGRGRT